MLRSRIGFVITIVLAIGCSAVPYRALAQSPVESEALKAAKDLMAVISADTVRQMVSGLTNQVWPSIERAVRTKRADIDQATLSELRAEFEGIQRQYMATVMIDVPAIYARHFTAQELRDILAFYRTPAGEKSMRVLPQVMSEVFGMIAPRLQAVQAQVMDAFTKVLRKRGINI